MKFSTLLGVAVALGVSPATLWAADVDVQAGPAHVKVDTSRRGDADRHEANKPATTTHSDRQTPKGLLRASEMMNQAVYNRDEEQVGTITDVVLDTKSGDIKYVALSTGGFLGLGDELHAVPWKSLSCETRDGERYCVLDVDQDRLEKAEGFDQDNWPNMADKKWCDANDRQYGAAKSSR